jgi:hypothetical protein
MTKLLFIIYDGIKNSVFQSQVLIPLSKQFKKTKKLKITIVSFEKHRPNQRLIQQIKGTHHKLKIIILKKLPYFGKLSLCFAIPQLKKIIKKINPDDIICRGPLAGFIAIKGIKQKNISLVIQARGLCAQEYRFATQNRQSFFFKKILHTFIFKSLEKIERWAFSRAHIQAVSPALKDYLVQHFHTHPKQITIASHDFPSPINQETKKKYKKEIREKLQIPHTTSVYCYSGSAKPWQCIEKSIDYFANKSKTNPDSFLLLFSQDKKDIEKKIQKNQIPKQKYKILNIPPRELTKYLCACDYGFLFREKDVINFVSRPTKMLEYQSANLEIIHNQTIAWLMKDLSQSQFVDQS